MRSYLLLALFSALLASGCDSVECGDGTIERDGACVRADQTVGTAKCGPFTKLVGDVCLPEFPPTVCDSSSTEADVDDATGVTTCFGTGVAGCSAPLPCPMPSAGKQTICGRIFDFQNNTPFAVAAATGLKCTGTEGGPCTLGVKAYDALAFAGDPTIQPLAADLPYIDDCGRYRLTNITTPGGPFVAIAIDDAMPGPAGTTNPTGVATPTAAGAATKDLDAFIASAATTSAWSSSGGPPISGGIYAMVFRAGKAGTETRAGITATLRGMAVSQTTGHEDHYFAADDATRTTIAAAATVTGVNGTALVTGASTADMLEYSGSGLPPECVYTKHAGASIPNVLFIQVLRPTNAPSATCPL